MWHTKIKIGAIQIRLSHSKQNYTIINKSKCALITKMEMPEVSSIIEWWYALMIV